MKPWIAFMFALLCGPAAAQMPTFNVGQGGMSAGLPTGPVDIVGSPIVCYSLRACSTPVVAQLVNICNAANTVCANISSLADGNFDTASAAASPNCTGAGGSGAGGTCTIQTWYDQSGNGNHVTQATPANRPTLSFGCTGSGRPCAVYSGTQELENGSVTGSSAQPFSISAVAKRTGTFSAQNGIISVTAGTIQFVFTSTASQIGIYAGGTVPTATATDNLIHSFQLMFTTTGGAANLNVDGSNNLVTLTGGGSFGAQICLGLGTTGSCAFSPLTGQIMEVIAWGGDKSASFSSLCHNQFIYWGSSASC